MNERSSPEKRNPEKIFDELNKVKEKKNDVSSTDREFEKSKDECTFKPNILRIQGSSPSP